MAKNVVTDPKIIKIIRQVQKQLKEHPEEYDQGSWARNCYRKVKGKEVCTTACCIAGTIVSLHPNFLAFKRGGLADPTTSYRARLKNGGKFEGEDVDIENFAADMLEPHYTDNLFAGSGIEWPFPFNKQWLAADGDKAKQAKVAIARLDYFLKHGK